MLLLRAAERLCFRNRLEPPFSFVKLANVGNLELEKIDCGLTVFPCAVKLPNVGNLNLENISVFSSCLLKSANKCAFLRKNECGEE